MVGEVHVCHQEYSYELVRKLKFSTMQRVLLLVMGLLLVVMSEVLAQNSSDRHGDVWIPLPDNLPSQGLVTNGVDFGSTRRCLSRLFPQPVYSTPRLRRVFQRQEAPNHWGIEGAFVGGVGSALVSYLVFLGINPFTKEAPTRQSALIGVAGGVIGWLIGSSIEKEPPRRTKDLTGSDLDATVNLFPLGAIAE